MVIRAIDERCRILFWHEFFGHVEQYMGDKEDSRKKKGTVLINYTTKILGANKLKEMETCSMLQI